MSKHDIWQDIGIPKFLRDEHRSETFGDAPLEAEDLEAFARELGKRARTGASHADTVADTGRKFTAKDLPRRNGPSYIVLLSMLFGGHGEAERELWDLKPRTWRRLREDYESGLDEIL